MLRHQAAEAATVWIHDYNLWLVPGYIRELRPDLKIAFFHHTPFPGNDVFAILPWREQILESLLSCDVVGFHIPRYTENFARAANCLLGAEKGSKQPVNSRFVSTGSALTEPSETPCISKRRMAAMAGDCSEGDDGTIKIHVDREAKTLTISDNGIGMTADEVKRYINQVAFSSAEDFLEKYKQEDDAIIGHFGLGFYSSFMVAARVELLTKSAKPDHEAVLWSCDGSISSLG